MTNLLLKLNSILSSGTLTGLSSLAADGDITGTVEATSVGGMLTEVMINGLVNFINKVVFVICSFILNVIELLEYIISTMLGITVNIDDYVVLDTRNPLIKMLTNETVLRVFRIVMGVAIVLIIVFTIFAIIKSEYSNAADMNVELSSKGRIFGRALRSFFILGMFPLFLLVGIILINAILAGFNDILRGGDNATIAGQIFITSSYNANKYRKYADNNVRVPIIVNFEDPIYLGQENAYSTEELYKIYHNFNETGKRLYDGFADNNFDDFGNTVVYRNNRIYNQDNYNEFEHFICTREQYYVMADFIDYAVKHNLTYYVKSMKDPDITWKYVSDQIYDAETQTLKITYQDASNLNDGQSYTVFYSPSSEDIVTPISDAMKTITALLAIGQYSENTFNLLKRVENSINVVEWESQKVYLRLSKALRDTITSGGSLQNAMTTTDQLLLFERARYQYNNSLDCTIDDLINGYEVSAYKLENKVYQASSGKYVVESEYYVVPINGVYYRIELNNDLKDDEGNFLADSYGDPYYTIAESYFGLSLNPQSTEYDAEDIIDLGTTSSGRDLGTAALIKTGDNKSFMDIIVDFHDGVVTDDAGNSTLFADTVTECIKQVSWPQKLISDLQVIYKDININDFITKNKWLTELGEYYSAQNKDDFSANITTSLIHPLGLIMSELFLGDIEEADGFNLYGNLKFSGRFDEETLHALMRSLCGEENYFQLKAQFEYFNEIYNAFMGPLIDEIAFYNNFELLNGSEASVELYTYKAYLASMLISSSAAEWFYKTAISMLGAYNFGDDIINPNSGYYYNYSELTRNHSNYRTILNNIWDTINATLKADGLVPGGKNYPEYMYAFAEYIGKNLPAINWFDGREDMILNSWEPIGERKYKLYVAYKNVYDAYYSDGGLRDIIDDIKSEYPDTGRAIEDIFDIPDESFTFSSELSATMTYAEKNKLSIDNAGDVFAKAIIETAINQLKTKALGYAKAVNTILEGAEEYDSSFTSRVNVTELSDAVEAYTKAISEFASAKKNYNEQDYSYQNNGKMSDIKRQRDDEINLINELLDKYEDLKKISNGEIFIAGIKDKKNIFGVEINSLESWNSIYDKMMNTCDNIEILLNNPQKLSEAAALYYGRGATENDQASFASVLSQYATYVKDYFKYQVQMDRLNRYYITFAATTNISQDEEIKLDVVVNNKHYTTGQNFTNAKFVEYVLGAEFLNNLGIETVFVDKDYKGLLDYTVELLPSGAKRFVFGDAVTDASGTEQTDIYGNVVYKNTKSFSLLQKFAGEVGEISKDLYQMTNLTNLASNTHDEITLGATSGDDADLAKVVLDMIISGDSTTGDYIPYDILMGFFDISNEEIEQKRNSMANSSSVKVEDVVKSIAKDKISESSKDQNNKYLNTVLGYLLLTDTNEGRTNYVDYSRLTLKEVRTMCMKLLVDYEKQDGETVTQNQMRYMALLALCCSDWKSNGYFGPVNNSWAKSRRVDIYALETDMYTQATIRRLAGIKDRPATDIVDAEYTIDFNSKGVDEANGDIFIICTFDEETKLFVPFMMSNNRGAGDDGMATDEDGNSWLDKFGFRSSYTEYYVREDDNSLDVFFPVIAKGYITEDGYPTAIRENEGRIECYRDNVVIHDVSNMGLSTYYASMDQIVVTHTGISYLANMISKMATGKTLVEHMVDAIPRFAAHSDLNFCYGVTEQVADSREGGKAYLNFNFADGVGPKMELLYRLGDISMLVLIIGTVTVLMALWKALWGITARMFDVTIYFMLGPAVISTIPLRSDSWDSDNNAVQESGNDMYERWKDGLIGKLLNVFSYAIGFNIFFIVVPVISSMTLFTSTEAFASLPLLGNISLGFLNEAARLIFLIAAAYLSTSAPALFAQISQTANAFDDATTTLNNVKDAAQSVKDVWSGQAMLDTIGTAKDSLKNMIPGYAIAKKAKEKTQKTATKLMAKVAKKIAVAHGVPPQVAEKAAGQLEQAVNKKQELNTAYGEKKQADRSARMMERVTGSPPKAQETAANDADRRYERAVKVASDVQGRRKEGNQARKEAYKTQKKAYKRVKKSTKSQAELVKNKAAYKEFRHQYKQRKKRRDISKMKDKWDDFLKP